MSHIYRQRVLSVTKKNWLKWQFSLVENNLCLNKPIDPFMIRVDQVSRMINWVISLPELYSIEYRVMKTNNLCNTVLDYCFLHN